MADNKENSRADEIFEILQDFRDDSPKASGDQIDNIQNTDVPSPDPVEEQSYDTSDDIDEILDILSAGLAVRNGTEQDSDDSESLPEPYSDGEIPVSIFSHLSDESEIAESTPAPSGEINSHFSDIADEDIPLPPEDEEPVEEEPVEDDEDEEEETEKEHPLFKVGNIFQKMSAVPKAIIYILIILVVSAYLSYYIITIGNDIFALVTTSREVTVTIDEGMTHEQVGEMLEAKEIIEYGWVYELYMSYRGDGDSSTEYIPGEYKLNTNMNYSQIITLLTTKTNAREIVRVTIPEGFTVDQIIDTLVEKGIGTREGYIEAINNYPYKWEFVEQLNELGYSENRKYRLEGYLYPDTYDFYTTESEVYVINKMLAAFDNRFWKDFNQKSYDGNSYRTMMLETYGLTFDDVVVLASMIQSEGGTAEDFYYISHVFHNRLSHKDDFPYLESDATIQYVLPERETDSSEINIGLDDPYNTYMYMGLPPGAISNAGLDALNAALFPTKPMDDDGDEFTAYYFVSNDAGKTYYATTLNGHNKNVAQVKKDNAAMDEGTYKDPDDDYE